MSTWWPLIGETSLMAGGISGFIWAVASTMRRRTQFRRLAARPIGQFRWFLVHCLGMGAYISLVVALGLSAVHDIIPQQLFWFLLGLSALAFGLALMIPGTATRPAPAAGAIDLSEPPLDPPVPARRMA